MLGITPPTLHPIMADSEGISGASHDEELLDYYYFHPDHLGSSSYITNGAGTVSQHMEYLPFGETLVDEHVNSNNSPFKFNGKEYDEETGNYYYGARYYDPKLSIFISVDLLVEKTKDAYGYCYQNPINLTNPNGMTPDGNYFYKTGEYLGSDNAQDNKTYNLTPSEHDDRNVFECYKNEFKDRVPNYFEVYIPASPNMQVHYNDTEVIKRN